MMSVVTRSVQGHTISARCAAGQEVAAGDLLDSLARDPARPLAAGYRFRFGWSMFTLQDEAGALVLCEPDFDGDALLRTRPTVEVSLEVIAEQIAFLRRTGAPAGDVRFDDAMLVERGALDDSEIAMLRAAPVRAGDSGWRIMRAIGPRQPLSEDDLETIVAYRLLTRRRIALITAALPEGYGVAIVADRVISVMPPPG